MSLAQLELEIKELEAKLHEITHVEADDSISIKELQTELRKKKEEAYGNLSAYDRVYLARKPSRPHVRDYIENIFDDFIELHGDRLYKDDHSLIGGIALFRGLPVTVVGQVKGRNIEENMDCNFGMSSPEGYRKAMRLMKQAEKFNRPIITFIDTPGAYPGLKAEKHGIGEAIARNLMEMSTLKVPVLAIVMGEGGSGGALALSVADRIVMLENSVYSILSPEGFASILWKDKEGKRVKEAAELMKMTAQDLFDMKIIDKIIKEPQGGAKVDSFEVYLQLREYIQEALTELKKEKNLVQKRYQKFREIGL